MLLSTLPVCALQAFVLMVTVTFENVAHKEAFTAFWQPLAHYVRGNEPGTLAFELLQSDSKPTELLVYERYEGQYEGSELVASERVCHSKSGIAHEGPLSCSRF